MLFYFPSGTETEARTNGAEFLFNCSGLRLGDSCQSMTRCVLECRNCAAVWEIPFYLSIIGGCHNFS
jgi:hypothetical protein